MALAVAALGAGLAAGQPTGTVRVASGLDAPSQIVAPPDVFFRLFVLERTLGQVLLLDLVDGTFAAEPFFTVPVAGEGLLGLAFHPRYGQNGHLFVYYFAPGAPRTVVERYTRDPEDPDRADPASARTVIEIPQPFGNHNGGWLGFGPDGYLYLPLGDGGSACDPLGHGQNTQTLLGSLLRLDVDGDDFPADPARNYAIPPDNPFVGVAGADEIWSYGLRNPFRASFDRATGDLYLGDVGQTAREEIDFQPASSDGGENWGWDLREGSARTPDQGGCAGGPRPPANVDPIYDYAHGAGANQGKAVIGGYVYRGPGAGGTPTYFFGDFVNERIWSIDAVDGTGFTDWTATLAPDVGEIRDIVSFGEDGGGYLYVVDQGSDPADPGGEIFRFVVPAPFVPCPDLVLDDDEVLGDEVVEHCRNIALGPGLTVAGGGDLTLRAGNRVSMNNGLRVALGGRVGIELDAALTLVAP